MTWLHRIGRCSSCPFVVIYRIGRPPVTATREPDSSFPPQRRAGCRLGPVRLAGRRVPSAVSSPKFFTFSAGIVAGINGVQMGPGATLLARIPFCPNSCAKLADRLAIAALVAA